MSTEPRDLGIVAIVTAAAIATTQYLAATTNLWAKFRYKLLGGNVSTEVAQKAGQDATEARMKSGASLAETAVAIKSVYGKHNVDKIMESVK